MNAPDHIQLPEAGKKNRSGNIKVTNTLHWTIGLLRQLQVLEKPIPLIIFRDDGMGKCL